MVAWRIATLRGAFCCDSFRRACRPKPPTEVGSIPAPSPEQHAAVQLQQPEGSGASFSSSAPPSQLAPDALANTPQPSLNPFETVTPPSKDASAQPAGVPLCAQGQKAVRLPTGTRIEPDVEVSGPSELTVSNGTRSDAAVRLVNMDSGNTARFVYIAAGDDFTLTGIEPGTYGLRFVSGKQWVPACRDLSGCGLL